MTTLQFGEFELDCDQPVLARRGRPVNVQELPLRLLVLLATHPGELMTREALFQHFWPQDTSGLLDDNLNTLVRKLRQALNDSARSSRFIETVPKKGYRFIAPVISVAQPMEALVETAPAQPRNQIRPLALAGLCIVLLGSLSLLLYSQLPHLLSPPVERAPLRSVAVMPFVNASENNQRDYFSDGLADDLLSRLSGFKGLRVVSRTSSFALRGTELDARNIGQRLGTDALVEGSVRRDGEQLRINVRLVDARDGYQLWSRSYQRELTNIFAVQEEIAQEIAGALAGELHGAGERSATVSRIPPAAYDNYLKGRFYWHKRSQSGLLAAVDYFEQSIAMAPDYAPAWAGLADALAVLGFYDYLAPSEAFTRARGAARRTLQLDPANASAEANLGYVALYYDWDLKQAESHFLQAIAFKPDSSKAHQWYANLLVAAGRFGEAEREMRRATELDPLSLIANAALGWVLYHAGQYDMALEQLALAQELDPDFELVYLWRGWTLEAMGDLDGAKASLQENVSRSQGSAIGVASLARVLALGGQAAEASALLTGLESGDGYIPSYEMAKAYLALGDLSAVAHWLQRAAAQNSHSMVFLNVDPQLADFRETAAYTPLAEQVASGH